SRERRFSAPLGDLQVSFDGLLGSVRLGEQNFLLHRQQIGERRRIDRPRWQVILSFHSRCEINNQTDKHHRRYTPQPIPQASFRRGGFMMIAVVLHGYFPFAGGLHLPSLVSLAITLRRRLAESISSLFFVASAR